MCRRQITIFRHRDTHTLTLTHMPSRKQRLCCAFVVLKWWAAMPLTPAPHIQLGSLWDNNNNSNWLTKSRRSDEKVVAQRPQQQQAATTKSWHNHVNQICRHPLGARCVGQFVDNVVAAIVYSFGCCLCLCSLYLFFLPFKFYGFMFAARTFTVFIVSWCVNLICACAAHAPTNNSLTRY